MAIHEYSVPNDYFQFGNNSPTGLDFPCCVCGNRTKKQTEYPCKFCGHNDGAEDFFHCCLCEEIQPGKPTSENILAARTPAELGPVCLTCRNTITADKI
jgi:hypothetical protein